MAGLFGGHGVRAVLPAVLLAAAGLAGVNGAATALQPARSAAPGRGLPLPNWIIKSNDLAGIGAQAEADGVTLPSFQYVACGSKSDSLACLPRQVPIFTDFFAFRAAVLRGLTGPVLIDYENLVLYPQAAGQGP